MRETERWLAGAVTGGWILIAGSYFRVDIGRPLATWDEQIYFNAAQNVLDGYWLLPRFALEGHPLPVMDPFLHKPPLVYWIQAAAMAFGGETPSVARWPSVIAMAGVVGLTVLLTWRLSGLFSAALSGGVALQIPALSGTHAANNVATDPFLLLFGFSAIYCLVRFVGTDDTRWAWLSGVCYGLAIMTKSVAAAPFGLFALPYLYRYRGPVGLTGFGRVVAGGLLVAAPWFLIAAGLAFEELIDQMFLRQVIDRATGERYVESEGLFAFMRYPYFMTADDYFGWPYFALGLAGLVSMSRWWLTERYSNLAVLMWPLALGVIGLYALIGGNHSWYVMPAAIPIAILVSDAVATSLRYSADVVGTVVALRLGPG